MNLTESHLTSSVLYFPLVFSPQDITTPSFSVRHTLLRPLSVLLQVDSVWMR